MEKRGKSSSSTRVKIHQKKKFMKRNKNRLFKKVVDYLRSDSYLYAPLLSSRPFTPGKGGETELLSVYGENDGKKKLMEKVVEYLKCDCYMYAPLLDSPPLPPPQQSAAAGVAVSVTSHHTTTAKPPTSNTAKKVKYSPEKEAGKPGVEGGRPSTPTKEREGKLREDRVSPPAARTLVSSRKTVAYSARVKHTVTPNCRVSSVPGALHETEPRELLVD